jgi:hypothetical protein
MLALLNGHRSSQKAQPFLGFVLKILSRLAGSTILAMNSLHSSFEGMFPWSKARCWIRIFGNSLTNTERLGDSKHDWLDSALIAATDYFKMEELRAILDQMDEARATDLGARSIASTPTRPDDDWTPIPLDREDPDQRTALKALEKTIEELRGDNGYAATNPEEKAFVQDKLSAVVKRLRDDSQISWMYLNEFAFRPLGILIKRFGQAAIGI